MPAPHACAMPSILRLNVLRILSYIDWPTLELWLSTCPEIQVLLGKNPDDTGWMTLRRILQLPSIPGYTSQEIVGRRLHHYLTGSQYYRIGDNLLLLGHQQDCPTALSGGISNDLWERGTETLVSVPDVPAGNYVVVWRVAAVPQLFPVDAYVATYPAEVDEHLVLLEDLMKADVDDDESAILYVRTPLVLTPRKLGTDLVWAYVLFPHSISLSHASTVLTGLGHHNRAEFYFDCVLLISVSGDEPNPLMSQHIIHLLQIDGLRRHNPVSHQIRARRGFDLPHIAPARPYVTPTPARLAPDEQAGE